MGNISKKAGGPIKADEVSWDGQIKNSKKADDAALLAESIGLGVSKPVPVAFPWTIYNVTSTEDDDKPGIYCLAVFDVPKDTMGLKIKYCYVKANGAYGRVKWFPSYRLDDAERTAGRVEIQFGPLRPNSRIDLVRLVAVKRAAKDVGNPPLGDDDRRGKGTSPAYTPPTLPVSGSGNPWGVYAAPYANQAPGDANPLTMGTILTGEYITGSPRILDVDPPKKEVDGVYYPVKIATTNSAEDLMVSVRFGVYRVGTKAGGANTYSRRIPTPRHELTEEEREELSTNGFVWVDVGPLKANKKYHIKWIRARYSLDPDDSGAKVVRHRHPLPVFSGDVDLTQDYLPEDIVDGQTPGVQHSRDNVTGVDPLGALIDPVPGGDADDPPLTDPAGFLAVLAPTGDITGPPSDPDASDIITNEPDDATEKDKDAIVVLRVWAAEGNRAKYAIDPLDPTMVSWSEANVNRAAVVIKTLLPNGVTYKQRRHGIDIEDPDAVFVDITFHRQIGKPLVWVKNVSLNEADREFSSTIDLAFTAGSGDASDITGFTLTVLNDSDDNRQADARVQWVNSATPPVAKKLTILRARSAGNPSPDAVPSTTADKANGNANWKLVFKKNLRADSDTLALPSSNIDIYHAIPGITDAAGDRDYIAYLWIAGNPDPVHSDTYNNAGEPADAGADSPITGDASAPSPIWLVRNGATGDPADGNAEAVMRVTCDATGGVSANTFADVNTRQVGVVLYGWTPAGAIDTGEKHIKTVEVDPTAKFVDISMSLKLGKKYTWWDNVAYNHDDTHTTSSGTPTGDFTAGTGGNSGTFGAGALTGAYAFNAASLTSKAQVITAVDARHTDVEIEFVQPSIPVLIKKILVEVKYGSNFTLSSENTGAARPEESGTIRAMHDSILDDAAQYSVASTSYTSPGIIRRVKHRKNQTIFFRSVIIPFGSTRNSANTWVSASSSLTVTDDNVTVDTAVPSTVSAPTGRYKDGGLRLKCNKPASNTNTLDYYEWQISNDPAFSTGASIYYIQDNDTTPVTSSSSTIQTESRKLYIPVTRTDLALLVPVSGSTARRPVLNFRVRGHNSVGDGTYSSAGTLTIGREGGDINRHGATGRINMIDGGGFMSSRWNSDSSGPTDQPFKIWKYRVVTGMSGPAYRIENTRSGTASGTNSSGTPDSGLSAVIWDSTNHQLDFGYRGTGSTLIYCNAATKVRRQFVAGEVYTLTFDLKSATANFDPGTLIVAITNDNGSSAGLASQSLTFSNADASSANPKLGTSYRPYKVTFTLSGSPTGSAWIYFSFSNSGWSSGQHVYLDNVCLVRGNQAMLFEASAADIAIDESPLVTNFANGTESIGDAGGNGDDGIGDWGYMDV